MAQEQLSGIKNIIIDMGGVILDIDHSLTAAAFKAIGVENFESLFTKASQSGFIEEFESGNLSPDEFRNQVRAWCGIPFSSLELDAAWNALILDLKPSRVAAIQSLSQRFNLYLLSNNNAIHYLRCIEKINALLPFEVFSSYFKQNYYSHILRLRKPEKAAFEFVLRENKLNLSETIFWDDSLQHIESAQTLGIRTITISPENTIEQLVAGLDY